MSVIWFSFLNILFTYIWLSWVFVAAHGLSLLAASRAGCSLAEAGGLLTAGASLVEHGLWRSGSVSYGSLSQLPLGMWTRGAHARPGIGPMFPVLASRFLTTNPPGKSWLLFLLPTQLDTGPDPQPGSPCGYKKWTAVLTLTSEWPLRFVPNPRLPAQNWTVILEAFQHHLRDHYYCTSVECNL